MKTLLIASLLLLPSLSLCQGTASDQIARSETIYRILNDAHLRFESTLHSAMNSAECGETGDAKTLCSTFLSELEVIRAGLSSRNRLTPDDVRYISRELNKLAVPISDYLQSLSVIG